MSTPRYRSAPPSRSGSAISVSTATTPSRPGLNSLIPLLVIGADLPHDGTRAGARRRVTILPRMPHVVTLVPGDGTGPELTEATRRVLEATGVDFEWDIQPAGADVMHEHGGDPLPESTL